MASRRFEELDWQQTPSGAISLRRRVDPVLGVEVHEVRLDDDYLMSSLFVVAEEELARLGLAALDGRDLSVVVGGLGLGFTAAAALDDDRVARLDVVEALAPVVDWHERGLVPLGPRLAGDPRCSFVLGDFFALAAAGSGFGGAPPPYDAVLLDVDHSPRHLLQPGHAPFYEPDGLRRLAAVLRPGGVFALWSDDPPDEGFLQAASAVFATATAHVVAFDNPLTGGTSANTAYVATTAVPSA